MNTKESKILISSTAKNEETALLTAIRFEIARGPIAGPFIYKKELKGRAMRP